MRVCLPLSLRSCCKQCLFRRCPTGLNPLYLRCHNPTTPVATVAARCKTGLDKPICLLAVAHGYCVLRSGWCQKWCQTTSFSTRSDRRHRYLALERLSLRISNSTTKVMRAVAATTTLSLASETVAERLSSLCGCSSGPLYSG
jgi:hypothetical protein